MYVCVCNALKEDTVRALAEEGLSFKDICNITGCSSNCGSCQEYAEALVSACQSPHRPAAVLPLFCPA